MRRIACFVMVGASLLACGWSGEVAGQTQTTAQNAAPPIGAATPTGTATLAPLVDRVAPAVVNIAVISRSPTQDNPLFRDPYFRRFFNLPDPRDLPPQMSAGSGVIVDAAKGYVVTNHHVVEHAQEITVTLRDRRVVKAKRIGSDADTDIALLQIKPDHLTAVPLGNSDAAKVGDYVIAIGNPFGLGGTVTLGIISALGRSGLSAENYEDFIQTDASVNPGNSGGGLINMNGELMGINTAILAPSGGNVGIGFAVPSNMVRTVMDQLIQYGEVRRGRLGVEIRDLTPALAATLGVSTDVQGAVVSQVEPGSPAEKAGIRPGDVIAALNGRSLRGATDLRNRIGLVRVGSDVELKVIRDGRERTMHARVGRAETAAGAPTQEAGRAMPSVEGATLQDIQPGMPMYGKVEGVVVADIDPGSPAASEGLRAGDVIVGVNRKPVHSVAEFDAALRAAQGPPLALDVLRGDRALFLVIT